MPLVAQTFSAVLTLPYTEVSFGTITPNFDQLDVYADMTPLTNNLSVIWRLYATSGGIKTLAGVSGAMGSSFGPQRVFADQAANPATVYELTGELTGTSIPGITLKAGMVGYDLVVNDTPPATGTLAFPLVYGAEVPVTTLPAYHQQLQVDIDVTNAGAYSASTWRLYANVTGLAGTISVLVASTSYQPAQNASQKQIVIQAKSIGASSYALTCQGDNPDIALLGAPPVVTGSLTGYSETLDGTGPATLYYQTVENGGAAVAQQPTLNFIGFTVADNPGNSSTDVTAPAGGITQLTNDVTAGPGAGSQSTTATKATGEITGPGVTWWYPNKGGSIGLYNSPDGSPVSIYRQPSAYPGNPNMAYTVINADASNVYVGGTSGGGSAIQTHLTAQHGVFIHGESNRVVRNTKDSILNGAQSIFQIWQPDCFANIETYLGGPAAFTCDTTLYATTFIECNFGAAGGTINLPAAEAGRVLNIGDAAATISVGAPLVLNPGAKGVNGGGAGVSMTITTPGWAGKLVMNSTATNWILF